MPKSKDERNAIRRAKYKRKKIENEEASRRISDKASFESYWKKLETNRKRSKKHKDEQKRLKRQAA